MRSTIINRNAEIRTCLCKCRAAMCMHDSVIPQSMHVHGFINIEGIPPTDLLYAELVVHSHPGLLQATASDLHDAAGVPKPRSAARPDGMRSTTVLSPKLLTFTRYRCKSRMLLQVLLANTVWKILPLDACLHDADLATC